MEKKRNPWLDLRRLTQLPLSLSPALYFTTMEMDDAKLEMINSHGTQAFFSGQAGDSVLLATAQPLPAIDYAHMHGLRSGLWQHVIASAALSRESSWSVLRKSISHGLLHRRYESFAHHIVRPSLLTDEIISGMMELERAQREEQHAATSALPPGKRAMSRGVGATSYYDYTFHAGNFADHVNPLDTQPLWELMLRVPTYTVLMDGTSRGLARHAFRDMLPTEIRKRISKGSGSPFYQHIVKRHRGFLRDYLLSGELVKDGYLDRRKVDDCLAADDPSTTIFAPTLLNYLSAEIWLQHWRSAARLPVAAPAHRRSVQ